MHALSVAEEGRQVYYSRSGLYLCMAVCNIGPEE